MPNDLKIQIVVEGAQQAASAVRATSDAIAEAALRNASAQNTLRDAVRQYVRGDLPSLEVATKVVATAQAEAAASAAALQAATQGAAEGMTQLDRAEALATARMAGFATGTGMLGTALGRVAAASSTLGPLMAAAFPVLAVGAIVDIVGRLPGLFEEIIDDVEGWDSASKKAYSEIVASNTNMLLETTRLKIQVEALNEIGLTGSAKYVQAIKNNADALKAWGATSSELLRTQRSLQAQIEEMRQAPATVPGAESVAHFFAERSEKMKQLRKDLDETTHALEVVNRTEQELAQVEGPKALKDRVAAAATEAKRLATESLNAGEEFFRAMERAKLSTEQLRDEQKQLADAQQEFGQEQVNKKTIGDTKDLEDRAAAEREFQQERVNDQRNAQLSAIQLQERNVQDAARLGQISAQQEVAQLSSLAAQKLAIETQYLDRRINEILDRLQSDDAKSYAEDVKEWSKLLSDKLKAQQQYEAARQRVTDTAMKEWQKAEQGAVKAIGNDLASGITQWMTHQATFGRAMQDVWTHFATTAVSSLVKTGVQMAINAAQQKAITASTQIDNAKDAAGATWAAVSKIPVIGPFLAPELAAAAFAGVMAFHEGGIVPGNREVPALLMGGERVLTKEQQSGMGNTTTVHLHYNPSVRGGGSAASTKDMLDSHGRTLTRSLQRMLRKMNR